jgi:hypothetical protein
MITIATNPTINTIFRISRTVSSSISAKLYQETKLKQHSK